MLGYAEPYGSKVSNWLVVVPPSFLLQSFIKRANEATLKNTIRFIGDQFATLKKSS